MAAKDVNLKFPVVHASLESFKGAKRAAADDVLAKFEKHDGEEWWTGQIVVYEENPLPATVKVFGKPECREKAKKGWIPLAMVDAEIRKMFFDFYAGKEMPPALAKALPPEAAKPEPAKAAK